MRINSEMFRMIRIVYRLSQQEYADLIDCSVSLVSKIENGQRNITPNIERKLCAEISLTEEKVARIVSLYYELNRGVCLQLQQ